MKSSDRQPLPESFPFAFGSGECPVEGFTIRAGLGQSELVETYLAEDAAGNRVVLRRLRGDAAGVELSADQACAHVAAPREVGRSGAGEVWLVRDYLTGLSLADLLAARDRGMPLKDARRWIKGIAAGLRELAQGGAVHGRLKPSNIWLERGVVKLVDGAAGIRDCPRTSRYSPPETLAGRYDRADVYALGVMLVEMLSGRTFDEVWQACLAEPYVPILARALDPDPGPRWSSVEDFLDALNAAPQQLPAPAAPSPPNANVRESASVVLWAFVAATVLILAVALSLMLSLAEFQRMY